ncbi:MAG: 5-(carboxyamino)imidazole ribonucleotide mutase [Verrucomicrobiota bacterium]|nr:5-(carboxyamino)imidazole ribonucleotide mutase [Verrucomicrobiota bacterium]
MKNNVNKPVEVALVMGSDSDWPTVKEAAVALKDFGIACEAQVISAHRTPDRAAEFAKKAAGRGIKVIIAAAGGAAHLGGALAAHTTLPVIGLPIKSGALNGIDALLAIVQMPAGIPVATVTLGSAGPVNAAVLAAEVLALGNAGLRRKLDAYKKRLQDKVAQGDAKVRADLKGGTK